VWAGRPTFPEARAFAHAAEVEYWSGAFRIPTVAPHLEIRHCHEVVRMNEEALLSCRFEQSAAASLTSRLRDPTGTRVEMIGL
jgi:hypothetical protein